MKIDRDRLHLLHIRDSVDAVLKYSKDITFDDFKKRGMDYDAILMRIIAIGEAVNELSNEFKEKHYNLPWHEAVGFRNKIAHGYLDADLNPKVIWQTVKDDLPELKNKVEKILK